MISIIVSYFLGIFLYIRFKQERERERESFEQNMKIFIDLFSIIKTGERKGKKKEKGHKFFLSNILNNMLILYYKIIFK